MIKPKAIVIGASAGAVDALGEILPRLPQNYPIPIIIVVHVPVERKSSLVELFRAKCRIEVVEAEEKDSIRGEIVAFAPADYHLLIEKNCTFSFSSDELVNFSRPSIDVLFETAADAFGPEVLGIVLTGASKDGARGARMIEDAGGRILVQQIDQAFVSFMPEATFNACRKAEQCSLAQIANILCEFGKTQ